MEAPARSIVAPSSVWSGRPRPLGATWDGGGVNFALFSAQAEKVPFIDLNDIAARRYEELGEAKVKEFFPHEHTHTNAAGADDGAVLTLWTRAATESVSKAYADAYNATHRNKVEVIDERLRVDNAMYRGADDKGRPFSLTAGEAAD